MVTSHFASSSHHPILPSHSARCLSVTLTQLTLVTLHVLALTWRSMTPVRRSSLMQSLCEWQLWTGLSHTINWLDNKLQFFYHRVFIIFTHMSTNIHTDGHRHSHMSTRIHTYTQTFTHVYKHSCKCTQTFTHVHKHSFKHSHKCPQPQAFTQKFTHMYTNIHPHVHNSHKCTQTFKHMHTNRQDVAMQDYTNRHCCSQHQHVFTSEAFDIGWCPSGTRHPLMSTIIIEGLF